MTPITRRSFLKGCCAAAGSVAGGGLTRVAFSDAGDTSSILIVLFQRGGCDGLNLFPPLSGIDRSEYEAARPSLRVPLTGPDAALDLNGQFGVHPAAAPLKTLYDQGLLAVVRATGNAVTPSRSHFDAQAFLESGTPESKGTGTGWLTRYFQTIPDLPQMVVLPSLAAAHHTPASFAADPYVLTMSNPDNFQLNTTHWSWDARQQEALADLYTGSSPVELAGAHALEALAVIAAEDFSGYVPGGGAVYPAGDLGDQFRMLAQIIKMNVGLRVGAVDFDGWDTHNNQGVAPGSFFADDLLAPFSQALHAFLTDLGASGDYLARTTVVVQTEFGRRFRENANLGTDHGFAADTLVLGGAVNGGQFYGSWPGLNNAQLFEGQDLNVTTDYRQVLSEVLIRRLENPNLGVIFPGYTGYQPVGVVQGADLPPVYDASNEIFSDGFEN